MVKIRSKKCYNFWAKNQTCDSDDTSRVGYFSLYRYATKWDIFMIVMGIQLTFIKSLGLPTIIVLVSEFATMLIDRTRGIGTTSSTVFLPLLGGGKVLINASMEENRQEILNDARAYSTLTSIISLIQLISGAIAIDCFNHTSLRQITRMRIEYFRSLLRQETGWHDTSGSNSNFAVRITEDIEKIREGIAEKVSHFLFFIMVTLLCLITSFIHGWELTLVAICYVPILCISNLVIGRFQTTLSTKESDSYSAAANVAEEVLNGIKTVFAFGGEQVEIERYNKHLNIVKKIVTRKGFFTGIGEGIMRFVFFGITGITFWYGTQMVLSDRENVDKKYSIAILFITYSGLLVSADNMGKTAPFLETFTAACGSASIIFKIIDRNSKIDSMSNRGKTIEGSVQGNISFKNVCFSYPSRSDVQVLRGFNLEITAGQSIAIVGNSGNGKSTCLQLLQRFYDPDNGQILLDDCDIRTLNVHALRSCIATVSQEPVLFSTTIDENIRYGKPDATNQEVVTAAENAGAHEFIAQLPDSYNTFVGEQGCQLSGGQKQRIAIARALIQNPQILLLDESTSALDYHSEKYVQKTLDRACKGRTTITVSHRLSAIRGADRIVFIDKGMIVEDGTHNQLVAMKGLYYNMIKSGILTDENDSLENQSVENELVESAQHSIENQSDQIDVQTPSLTANAKKSSDEVKSNESIHYWQLFKWVLKIVRSEWLLMLMAGFWSLVIGTFLPLGAILCAELYGNLALRDEAMIMKSTVKVCLYYIALAVVAFFATFLQTYLFSKASVNFITKVRSMTFAALIRQECGWFDNVENSSAALSARLTGDTASLQNFIGFPLSLVLQTVSTLVFGIFTAFRISWKLSLIGLSAFPFSLFIVIIESKQMSKIAITEKMSIEIGARRATEAVSNIRTVASLKQETYMIERFVNDMMKVQSIIRKKIMWRGIVNSTAQSFSALFYSLTLYFGSFLVFNGEIHFKNLLKISELILSGIMMFNHTVVFAPSFMTAFVGAHRLFQILDRKPLIQSPNIENKSRKPDKDNDIEYKKIDFYYPTRPDMQILKDFNLTINEGKTIAFVGPSGCGKSTCIQLLQRLYDPQNGRIYVGLDEISSDISLDNLRSKLSIVSQEPMLFSKTIAENIAYGDNSRIVPMDEIIEASKMANVHNFIIQLPLRYETNIGSKIAQLSGGQKQRIAIARAIVRNPKILLLDEATSSLDLHSEMVIQRALDSVRSGRTCLIIAHRLSTIQNADVICVLKAGSIIEYGTHNDLMACDGVYARLYNSQK